MSKRKPIRRGAFARGLSVSLAGARAGGAFAVDRALRKLRGEDAGNEERLAREADRFAHSLGELKGSYVKIGQLFALLGEHFLPPALTAALHRLESQTEPLDWVHMEPVLAQGLGPRWAELDIDRSALAAASLAQVHRGSIRSSGQDIVLKVQYPELTEVLDEDFDAVVGMLRIARWIPAGRDFDCWLETMREQLHLETDYPRERAMARRMAGLLADPETRARLPQVHIPAYYPDYCSDTVLAMDYVLGNRVTSAKVAGLPQRVRDDLGRAMLKLFFTEVFEWGLMQTDPNFGNYLIDDRGSRLSLLDFGSVLELEPAVRLALVDTIVAGHRGDDDLLIDALTRLGCLRADSTDYARETFRGFVRHLLEPLRHPDQLPSEYLNSAGQYSWARSDLLARVGRKAAGSAASRHFTMPSGEFALIARKLTGVFTFIAVLGAEFNAWDIVEDYIDAQEAGQ